jgi:hypothetical protein
MQSKHQNFLSDSTDRAISIPQGQPIFQRIPEPETIKHILIGSNKAVMGTIRVLHQLGYTDIRDWSPLLPTNNPGEFISVLIRSITVH